MIEQNGKIKMSQAHRVIGEGSQMQYKKGVIKKDYFEKKSLFKMLELNYTTIREFPSKYLMDWNKNVITSTVYYISAAISADITLTFDTCH